MVSDNKDNVLNIINQNDDDPNHLIKELCEDKIKLLNDKKSLLYLLTEKDEQLIKLSEKYQKKFENICSYLRSVEQLCTELNINDSRITDMKEDNRIIFDSLMDSSFSNSSFFTVTETGDSNFTTSSESLVAANGTLKICPKPKESYFSLNSLSNSNDFDKSDNEIYDTNYNQKSYPSSHCLQNNKSSNSNQNIESTTFESRFSMLEVPYPNTKKTVRKSSTIRNEKTVLKIEKLSNTNKRFSKYTDKEFYNWLVNVVRLPRLLIEDLNLKNKLQGICLEQITEQKLSKIFGTSDKLIRKKIYLALEETQSVHSNDDLSDNSLVRKDHLWVANVWLKKHLGLGHLSQAFLSRCVDGRLLKFIATCQQQKEFISLATTNYNHCSALTMLPVNFNKNISEPSKSDLRSIKFGLELLLKFNFDLSELEKRRISCENSNHDVLVWTNERIAKWFYKMNLKNYIRGIEYSGIHGGLMVLDPQFSMSTMSKLLQIPVEVVKKNNLDDKFSSLLKPSRFNEGVKSRRSTSLFRRRSFSQPRHSKSQSNRNPGQKASVTNNDLSDSASANEASQTLNVANLKYKEKSHTFDLSTTSTNNQTTNQNFVRKYRKSNDTQTRQDMDSPDTPTLSVPGGGQLSKTHLPKSSVYSAQISRKLKTKSVSESENSDDL